MASWSEAKERGSNAFKLGNYEDAVKEFGKAIQLDSRNQGGQLHILYSNRSAAYLSLGLASEALQDARRCVELDATFAKGYSRQGAALYRLGRYSESAEAYKKGLALDPGNADMRKGQQEAEKAMEEQRKATSEVRANVQGFVAKNRQASLLLLPRLLILVSALMYLMPLGSRASSVASYRRVFFASALTCAYTLYSNHGLPRWSQDYLVRVVPDPATQYLFLSLMLLATRPYALALGPVVLTEGIQFLWTVSSLVELFRPALVRGLSAKLTGLASAFTQEPRYGMLSADKKWAALFRRVPVVAVQMEIGTGLFMVLELLTPYRNIMGLFLYWQFLQMRYMLDRTGVVKDAFKDLDGRILSVTGHPRCPAVVGKGYNMLRSYLQKAVQLPDPQNPQAARPRCTIM